MSTPTYYVPALLTHEAAAAYLSLSPRSLNELQSRGEIIPKLYGTKRLFRRADLEELADRLPDWKPRGS